MMQIKHTPIALLFAIGGLAVLAACGGGSDSLSGIQTLGQTFQQAFNQSEFDEPIDISNADLVVNLTGEPFEL